MFAVKSTKRTLDMAARLVKANVRLHNAEAVKDDMAVIFAVDCFTRLEMLLLPYVLHKHTGLDIWSLAPDGLFVGRTGASPRSRGTVSIKDPDRDKMIVRALLLGDHPWIVFPEGGIANDGRATNHDGLLKKHDNGRGRPADTGAAVLALRTEFYRNKLERARDARTSRIHDGVLRQLDLESSEEVLGKRTVIVPVNITYFPVRAREDAFLRLGRHFAQDLSLRGVNGRSIEATVLSSDTDIDVALGEPIGVRAYLSGPEYEGLMACHPSDLAELERDAESMFNEAARQLTVEYVSAIDDLTTVNSEHVWAALLRYQWLSRFTDRAFRNRASFCAHHIARMPGMHVHPRLEQTHRDEISDGAATGLGDFMQLCIREGVVRRNGAGYLRVPEAMRPSADSSSVRQQKLACVIANEVEPLAAVRSLIKKAARTPAFFVARRLRGLLVEEDIEAFEEDYAQYYEEGASKGHEVGRPFLLKPLWVRGGVVMAHGYMAAPLEVRALAGFLCRRGYAVYAVRMKGHGTSPSDLARTQWEDWYESMSRGCAIIETLTDNVVLGGFSMGAGLALLGAGLKTENLHAVFAINAPLYLRSTAARLAPSVVRINQLLKKLHWEKHQWEFVENEPENPHINYTSNPVRGVAELRECIEAMSDALKDITVPTLVMQGSQDPAVRPDSAKAIFDKVGTPHKELVMLERPNHGIINGPGAEEVFERVYRFLLWARRIGPAS